MTQRRHSQVFLNCVRGLQAKDVAVYAVIHQLTFEHSGPVPNDPKWLSGWLGDMSPTQVRRSIERLSEAGKLRISGDEIATDLAETLQKRSKNQPKTNQKRSKNGAKTVSKLDPESNDSNDLDPPPYIYTIYSNPPIDPPNGGDQKKCEAKKKKRGARLPEDWCLPKSWGDATIAAHGWSEERVRNEAERFRDYWISKAGAGATKVDWQATWRNWCRTADQLHKPRLVGGRSVPDVDRVRAAARDLHGVEADPLFQSGG